jgi:hypothetical protein
MTPRRMVSVRLTEEEIAMLKKRGGVSAAIRRLIHGPELPPPSLLPALPELLNFADEVTMNGVRFIRDDTPPRPPIDIRRWQNHPVIQTEAACDLRSLIWVETR